MNKTLRKLGAVPDKSDASATQNDIYSWKLSKPNRTRNRARDPSFFGRNPGKPQIFFSLEIFSFLHLILGKSRIVTQLVDGSRADKNRLDATRPRQKCAEGIRKEQIYFLGIIPGKSVDNFQEVHFYIGGCFKTKEKKGHTVYGGCFGITRKKGHTVNTVKRFLKILTCPLTNTLYRVKIDSTKETQTSPQGTRKETRSC